MLYSTGLLAVFIACALYMRAARTASASSLIEAVSLFRLEYFVLGLALIDIFPQPFRAVFNQAHGLLIMFCVSWIGFHAGSLLDIRSRREYPRRLFLFEIIKAAAVSAAVSLLTIFLLHVWFKTWEYTPAALLTGIMCSFSLTGLRISTHENDSPVLPFGNLTAVIILGIVEFILFRSKELSVLSFTMSGIPILLTFALTAAAAGGILCALLIAGERKSGILPLIAAGCAAFLGGIAYTFSFSPLFVGVLAGMLLIAIAMNRIVVRETFARANGYIEKIFMFLLGTTALPVIVTLGIDAFAILGFAVALIILTGSLKFALARALPGSIPAGEPRRLLWAGIAGQGMLAAAAAVECSLQVQLLPSVTLLFIAMVVLNQLAVAIAARGSLKPLSEEILRD
jgi:hypothetical protein